MVLDDPKPTIDVSDTVSQRKLIIDSARPVDTRFAFSLHPKIIREPRIFLPNGHRLSKVFHESIDAQKHCIITNKIETSGFNGKWNYFLIVPIGTPCNIVCMWYNNYACPDSFRFYAEAQRDQGYVVYMKARTTYECVIVMKGDMQPVEGTQLKQQWRW